MSVTDNSNQTTRYLIDDLNLDIQRGELMRHHVIITLPKLSYDLLEALAHASPALLSQDELMSAVWPDRVIGDETLKQRVKLLRKSLGDDASNPRYIEAVRGRGYRLIPEVKSECIVKAPPAVLMDNDHSALSPYTMGWLRKRWRQHPIMLSAIIGVFILLVIASSASMLHNDDAALNLQPNEKQAIQTAIAQSPSVKANQYYQRGRDYYHRYHNADNDIAIDFFGKAISQDSRYSPAYAALSQAYSQRYFQFSGSETDKQLAVDNAYQALSIDNNSAAAYKALGSAYYVSGWLTKSIKALHRGLDIEPDEIEIMINLAYIYSEQGVLNMALKWHKKVSELAPNHALAMLHTGITLQRANKYTAAKRWYQNALNLQPDYVLTSYYLAQLAIEQKLYDDALAAINHIQPSHPQFSLAIQVKADIAYYTGDLKQAHSLYKQASEVANNSQLSMAGIKARLLHLIILKAHSLSALNGDITDLKHKQQQGNEQASISVALAEIYSAHGELAIANRYLTQAVQQGYIIDYRVLDAPLFKALREQDTFANFIKTPESNVLPTGQRKAGEL